MDLTSGSVAVMLPMSDATAAKAFYSDKLGLAFDGANSEHSLLYRLSSGTELVLLPRPDQRPSPSTAISFEVADLPTAIAELQERGVTFESYHLPEFTTVDHIWVMADQQAAWFKDPHGNVLCLHQHF